MPARAEADSNTESRDRQDAPAPPMADKSIIGTRIATYACMNTLRHSPSRGFSMVELLIVVAVIGLIVAIAVPNLVNAIQRARQTRSVADLSAIAKAVSMYQQDQAEYPIQTPLGDADFLKSTLLTYMGSFQATDGWMRSFMYVSDGHEYTILSYGMDGFASLPYTRGSTNLFNADIVITNGMFLQWPEGVQE